MTNHPITPPPELLQEWCQQGRNCISELDALKELATQAARWGAGQELEACCAWLELHYPHVYTSRLKRCRRPKPPSLKERALDSWDRLRNEAWCKEIDLDLDTIRRALEQLDD
jgi:hypothetical protein